MADTGIVRTFYQSLVHGSEHSRPYGEPEHYDRREPIGNALARIPEASLQDFAPKGRRSIPIIEGRQAIDLDDPQAVRERLAQKEQERRQRATPADLEAELAAISGDLVARNRTRHANGHARPAITENGTKYAGRGGGMASAAGASRDYESTTTGQSFAASVDILDALMEGGMPVKETAERLKVLWDQKAADESARMETNAKTFQECSRIIGQLIDQFDREQKESASNLITAETRITELLTQVQQLTGRLDSIMKTATGAAS